MKVLPRIDLHMHTTFSDGFYTPTELIKKVKDLNISIVSITDHDSLNGLEEATKVGKELNVVVIPGLEISTDVEDREVHLLGYFIDTNNTELNKYLRFFRDERVQRAKIMINKMANLGFDITINDVLEVAKDSAVGRPHIALAMMKKGIVKDYYEAFQKYLRDDGPAYERKIHVSSQSALKLISDAGGLSFIAHPGHLKESILLSLINSGVDGIEVNHPSHNEYQKKYYKGIVNQYCLLESGGSDFHGGMKGDDENLGKYLLDPKNLNAMGRILT